MRDFEAETFSGTVVETIHGELDVFSGDGFEPHLLREELASFKLALTLPDAPHFLALRKRTARSAISWSILP